MTKQKMTIEGIDSTENGTVAGEEGIDECSFVRRSPEAILLHEGCIIFHHVLELSS